MSVAFGSFELPEKNLHKLRGDSVYHAGMATRGLEASRVWGVFFEVEPLFRAYSFEMLKFGVYCKV